MTDNRKVKALGKLLLKLETRNRSGSGKKIVILFISYLLPALFLPFLLFRHTPDPTGFQYVFLTYLFITVLLCFTIISELDNLIVSKTEIELFGTLPLDDNVIVSAKMYMILRYILVITIPLLLPGSLLYYFVVKSISRCILFYFSGLMLTLFTANIVILIYCLALRSLKLKSLSATTYIFQVLLIFFLVLAYQFVSYSFTGSHSGSAVSYIDLMDRNGLLHYFPMAWYGYIPVSRNITADYRLLLRSFLPVVITYLSYISLKFYLAENYRSIRERFMLSKIFFTADEGVDRKFFLTELWNSAAEKIYVKNRLERSSFALMRSFLKREKAVKLNIFSMMLIPAGLTIFAVVTNQLPPPFGGSLLEKYSALYFSIFLCVFVVINAAVLGIKITGSPAASWIYDAYPMESVKRFKNGVRKFFVLYMIIPLCILLFVLFTVKIPLLQAAVHTFFIFSAANLYNTLCHSFSRALPFTKENTIINSIQRISTMFLAMLAGVPLIGLQVLVYRNEIEALLASVVLLAITSWLNYFIFIRRRNNNPI